MPANGLKRAARANGLFINVRGARANGLLISVAKKANGLKVALVPVIGAVADKIKDLF